MEWCCGEWKRSEGRVFSIANFFGMPLTGDQNNFFFALFWKPTLMVLCSDMEAYFFLSFVPQLLT